MRILLLSDLQKRGGAAVAAHRLYLGLQQRGCDVGWAAAKVQSFGPNTWQYSDVPWTWQVPRRLVGRISPNLSPLIERSQRVSRLLQIIERFQPDVINVHNIHHADLPPDLPLRLSQVRPVAWTMHDMWPFTGGCAYAYECRQFQSQCTAKCPYHDRYPEQKPADVPKRFHQRRSAAARAGRICFVAPSQWLADEAASGMFAGHEIAVIPYGLDLDVFRPIDRHAARQALGLPTDFPIIFSSADVTDPRKGVNYLIEALATMTSRKLTWLTAGAEARPALPETVEHHHLGGVSDERLMALAYSAADVHVLPTLADNLPNVLLEAAACGTPSIAFDRGGVRDAVVDGVTGWVTPATDLAALANAIDRCLDLSPSHRESLSRSCRAYAEEHWPLRTQAGRYLDLFRKLTSQPMWRAA